MDTRPANELLYDFEASLRLVDNAIGEFGAADVEEEVAPDAPSSRGSELPTALLGADGDITSILQRSRGTSGTLEQAAVKTLQQMNDQLRQVSPAS